MELSQQKKKEAYYANAVIKTPRIIDIRRIRLVIDSRERNMTLFPNPNKYEINLTDFIPNVSSIKLVSSTFPFSSYLINKNNNMLYVEVKGVAYAVGIEIGDYASGTDLATSMQNALNITTGQNIFLVDYLSRTDNFAFRCKNQFSMKFKGNAYTHPFNYNTDYSYLQSSIGAVIGFGIKDFTSTLISNATDAYLYTIKSQYRKNFTMDNCLIVHIGQHWNLNKSTAMSVDESFAIISRNNNNSYHGQSQLYDGHQIKKPFTPPIKKIGKISVEILDYYGNPYDFQNQDHRMEFVLDSQIIQHP
jgi:hypothetical protein